MISSFDGNDVRTTFAASTIDNPFTFTGQKFDPEAGLHYYKNRYYSCTLGRFVSRDPSGYESAINLQEYVGGNPCGMVDPSGEQGRIAKFFYCWSDCVQDNDPANLAIKAILTGLGASVPKTTVAWLADLAGDHKLAAEIRKSLRLLPKASRYTTIPSAISAKLQLGGRSMLRKIGRLASPVWITYGLALAAVEAHCTGVCCGIDTYDPSLDMKDTLVDFFFAPDGTPKHIIEDE